MNHRLLIYSDGGARGNPGPAAAAFVALNERGETLKTDAIFIGDRTNNQAEYEALLLALSFALEGGFKEVVCHLDSELVAKQLNGSYSVKNPMLQQLYGKVQALKPRFSSLSFINVRREHPQIQRADELVNITLDNQAVKRKVTRTLETAKDVDEGSVLVHTSIRCSNLDRSIAFYNRFFGMKLQSRREIKQTNAEIAFLQHPQGKGSILELTHYRTQTKFEQPIYEERLFDHLGFEVKDIQKTITAMRKENVVITDEPFRINEHTTIAFLEDPDGTLIELIQRD